MYQVEKYKDGMILQCARVPKQPSCDYCKSELVCADNYLTIRLYIEVLIA